MKVSFTILLIFLGLSVIAQPYTLDPTFQPFFNIRNTSPNAGLIYDVLEIESSGKLFLAGEFNLGGNGVPLHGNFTQTSRNGNYVNSFTAPIFGGMHRQKIVKINDSSFALVSTGIYLIVDSLGSFANSTFNQTIVSTIPCRTGISPTFFQDGSAILTNDKGLPNSCKIYSYNDTFPHQYLVKVYPTGFYDSSFKSTANYVPDGLKKYGQNNFLVFGLQRLFTHYNGRKVNALCKVFLNGDLDTTFTSPLSDTLIQSSFNVKILADGSIFLYGYFYLENDSGIRRTLVKLKPNGSLDSSFMNNSNALYNANSLFKSQINSIEQTQDGGYLVGGLFDSFQGQAKNSIVKIDSNGILEPQYFNSIGPDSSTFFHQIGFPTSITGIEKSKFGGYYVYGDFLKWDGQPSQPIIRIYDQSTGLESQNKLSNQLEIFPNPANEFVRVKALNGLKIRSIEVRNLLGQVQPISWTKESLLQVKINTSDLSNGVYLVSIETDQGSLNQKFIKQ